MVRTFETAYKYTSAIGSAAAYQPEELESFWRALVETPENSQYCEIGCDIGRSTSLILQAAIDKKARLLVIDSFEEKGTESAMKFMLNVLPLRWPFVLSVTQSDAYWGGMKEPIFDLVHIDGGHREEIVRGDCLAFTPAIKAGGFAVFHDYGGGSLPGVKKAVDSVCSPDEWEQFSLVNHCLILRRKDVQGKVVPELHSPPAR